MAGQGYFCARFDIDTIFTPWRTANWVSLFGDAELEYLPRLVAQARSLSCPVHFFALGFGVLHYPDLLKQVIQSGFALDSHLHTHIDLHPAVLAKHDPEMGFLPAVVEHARREGVGLADLRTIASQVPG